MSFLLGKKVKMSQVFKDEKVIPVTVVLVPENSVSLLRTKERDGYEAVQVQAGKIKREFRASPGELKQGDAVSIDSLKEGDMVRVSAYSKGRGFQGVVNRHGFH